MLAKFTSYKDLGKHKSCSHTSSPGQAVREGAKRSGPVAGLFLRPPCVALGWPPGTAGVLG